MPWTCRSCQSEVADDVMECAACAVAKTAWTLIQDQTRTLVVSKRRFELLRGHDSRTRPQDAPEAVRLAPAEGITVLDKAEVRAIAARGHLPASAYVLFVALYPGTHQDLTVTAEVLYAGQPSAEHALPGPPREGEVAYAKLLFVAGEGDLEGVTFPEVAILDVSEPGEPGYAPSVELRALGKAAQELPTSMAKLRPFAFSI